MIITFSTLNAQVAVHAVMIELMKVLDHSYIWNTWNTWNACTSDFVSRSLGTQKSGPAPAVHFIRKAGWVTKQMGDAG